MSNLFKDYHIKIVLEFDLAFHDEKYFTMNRLREQLKITTQEVVGQYLRNYNARLEEAKPNNRNVHENDGVGNG